MDWNVKLYIQPAAVGVRGGLKLTSPLYGASYTGTAFILLSWHERADLEGGKKKEEKKKTHVAFLNPRGLNCTHTVATFNKEEKGEKSKNRWS